jgi:hypothetical protein
MKIKLDNKNFEQTKFKGRALRNLLEIQDELESKQEEGAFKKEDLDIMCEFIVNVFDNQFTSDDLLDELEFHEIIQYFRQIAEEIMKKTNDKMGKLIKK